MGFNHSWDDVSAAGGAAVAVTVIPGLSGLDAVALSAGLACGPLASAASVSRH